MSPFYYILRHVDKFHDLGLCISFDQMLVLSTQPGNILCTQFESDAVIYPTKLRSNVLTTCNVDNIDHNQSCLSAKDSWHGTAISSTEHFESKTDGQTGKALFYPPLDPIFLKINRRLCSTSS